MFVPIPMHITIFLRAFFLISILYICLFIDLIVLGYTIHLTTLIKINFKTLFNLIY